MVKLRIRIGVLTKIIVFLTVLLVPLAAVTWYVSVRTLRAQMTEEFTSKGTAIANSLASSGVDLILNRDASTVQARVDEVIAGKDAISGVAYVMVYDPQKTLIAHTFHPIVPPDLIDKNLVPGETPKQVREIHYAHPVTGAMRSIIDVGVPMLAGQLGTVRVGMDKAIIEAAAAKPGWYLLLMFGGVALLAVMAGAVFARRITRPLGEIVRAAEQVGRGDLSHTVRVRSRDEIGQLARTFNDTVTRLRSQVTTETERDEEKRRREDLQKNIAGFLETVTKIAQGDLSRGGEAHQEPRRPLAGNLGDRRHDRGDRVAHEPPRAQRGHRGGGRRRVGRPLRRRRRRDPQARRARGQGHQGHRGPHPRRAGGDAGGGGGHGRGHARGGSRLQGHHSRGGEPQVGRRHLEDVGGACAGDLGVLAAAGARRRRRGARDAFHRRRGGAYRAGRAPDAAHGRRPGETGGRAHAKPVAVQAGDELRLRMAEPAEQEFLRSIFLMEAWDTVAALDRAAATLGRTGGVDELFVVTHRLKGAASLHGFSRIAALAAELEDVLGARPPDARKLSTLAGHLRQALDAVADGAPAPAGAGAEAARPAEAAPAPTSPGVPTARSPRTSADPLRKELETFFAGNADVLA